LKGIAAEISRTERETEMLLENWIRKDILVRIDNMHIATALRQKDELIENYFKQERRIMTR
jgi:hypothetical protein